MGWITIIRFVIIAIIIWLLWSSNNDNPWIKKANFHKNILFTPEELPSKLRNEQVNISEWTLNKDPLTKDIASYSDRTFNGTLGKLFSYKLNNYDGKAYQWKKDLIPGSPIDDWFLNKFTPILNQLYDKYGQSNEIKIRISTNPWKFHSHFDCVNNYGVQIYGQKSILLWSNKNHTKMLLSKLKNMSNNEAQEFLRKKGIKTILWKTNPGDLFYIPQGWFHKIESINVGPGSILLNYNINTSKYTAKHCENTFKHLWGGQTSKCYNKKCLD
jgi:hypothetical protein